MEREERLEEEEGEREWEGTEEGEGEEERKRGREREMHGHDGFYPKSSSRPGENRLHGVSANYHVCSCVFMCVGVRSEQDEEGQLFSSSRDN